MSILHRLTTAARLMGYEVVEDCAIEGMCCDCDHRGPCCYWTENENCQYRKEDGTCWVPYATKGADMDKPRICEILGVKVGEVFGFNDFPFDEPKEFVVNENGEIRPNGDGCITPSEICYIINNADCIIRKPRWTEQEVELAKALYDFRRSESVLIGRSKYYALWWRDGDSAEGILPKSLFPSLRTGESVKLSDIIGGAE